jgi:16S rRNA pseudouridine516 synthase
VTDDSTAQRLAKWIASSGFCSRRSAERLITQGKVLCNGVMAKHSDRVQPSDFIVINGEPLPALPPRQYFLYHKPVGIDCNNRPDDPASIYQQLTQLPQRVFAVGRLDKDSSGLLLLTNDGELSQHLIHPDYYHEKSYRVETRQPLNSEFISRMASGVSWQLGTNRYHSRPCPVQQLSEYGFSITLTQGLHRQIRYMCKALGFQVVSLQRFRLHNLLLGDLAAGEMRTLSQTELAGLKLPAVTPQQQTQQ